MKLQSDLVERTDLVPMAPAVGPFPGADFLRAWFEELGDDVEPLTLDWDLGQLSMMKTATGIEMMGETDLTDYHSPLGEGLDEAIALLVEELGSGINLNLDSLPSEAAIPLQAALENAGLSPSTTVHETAMVLALPVATDDFYRDLAKHERHELRRKRRRYESLIGPVVLQGGDGQGFDEFVRLHRLAPGEKGRFMTERRLAFFSRLARLSGWRVDSLVLPSGKAAACVFGWSDSDGYYLYNSCFDPALQAASPGLVLLQSMIEASIERELRIFDFLKGDEDYKVRLGAKARPLHRLEVTT
ncbi:MAG TPA: GNAT family N-acetyltransferase [Acidimicrobiia bacterium]|nr:GNAT family N-acetyltransferase [Acidimicrobiia bacterium]